MFARRRGFTLIELLVVIGIILLLAGLLLTGISAVRLAVARGAVQMEIQNLMTALRQYNNDFGTYPPGAPMDDTKGCVVGETWDDKVKDGVDYGAGQKDPTNTDCTKLELRTVTLKIPLQGGNTASGPYYEPKSSQVDSKGRLRDRFGRPYRYTPDGRNHTRDTVTGMLVLGRVQSYYPVIWSVGQNMKQDPKNNNVDDVVDGESNGKVDDQSELDDDICSWFGS